MHEASFEEEAFEQIRAVDSRYQHDAYLFVQEALNHTQKTIAKDRRGAQKHVTGQELLAGIRDFGLTQFGPMAMAVFEEWGIHACQDFGEIVFNMVEIGGASSFSIGDIRDLQSFASRLKHQSDPVSHFLWDQLTEASRQAILTNAASKVLEPLLVKELNETILNHPLYEEKRFSKVTLSSGAKSFLSHELQGVALARLNRLLLEDAYPMEITKGAGLLAKTERDSRADFKGGYDFCEAFRKPFMPESEQHSRPPGLKPSKV